ATISRANRDAVPGAEATMAALHLAETMQKVQRLGLRLAGLAALERPAGPDSLQYQYLNGFMMTIGGGTSEIRRNIVGERVLGLPKAK
ncbi:MAG TPA: acyl-CoA dehydrogenase family protein, partial [Nevskiaceae bacterium]|nr:acyl-CoA dehydrogenase family protein [Nevskiaceae bacterium]